MIEWVWLESNKHFDDGDPLKLVVKFNKDTAEVNETVRATLSFVKDNGDEFTGKIYTEGIGFTLPPNIKVVSMEKTSNSVYIDFYSVDEGTFEILAELYSKYISKSITINSHECR